MSNPRFTVKIKVVDNTTGNDGDIVVSNDSPDGFMQIGRAIVAVCDLINMEHDELKALSESVKEEIEKRK